MPNFMWLSNAPWAPSGYGQQTRINVPRLANDETGRSCGIICAPGLETGIIPYSPHITCFPKANHPYGEDSLVDHTVNMGLRMAFTLNDVWVFSPEQWPKQMLWIPWYPCDHDTMPAIIRQKLNSAWKRIAMSQFGVNQTHQNGMPCYYVPHSIETAVLSPQDKTASRAALNIPTDRWVVGIVAMNKGNPSRKNFVEQITAFANCKKRHDNWFLVLQTAPGINNPEMVNLPELCANLGLEQGRDFVFAAEFYQKYGFPPQYFAQLYSALDVLLMVTAGEGFGIPTIEAQACGCPVIGGDWMATSELVFSGRLVDRRDAEPFYSFQAANLFKPHIRAVEIQLEAEYRHASKPQVEKIKAEYDADIVYEKYWKPVMADIEAAL